MGLAPALARRNVERCEGARTYQAVDGEVAVEIQENIRGSDVFVVQPTCRPVDDTLMELLLLIDALNLIRRVYAAHPGAEGEEKAAGARESCGQSIRRALRQCASAPG